MTMDSNQVESVSESQERELSTLARIWEQVSTLILAVAIALMIRAFVVEPFRIPSGSMLEGIL